MTDYCHITDNIIDEGPKELPKNWKHISGLYLMDTAGLKLNGWLPVVYVNEDFDFVTQIRTGPAGIETGTFIPENADSITATYVITDKTAAEMNQDSLDAAQEAADSLTASDLATLDQSSQDASMILIELVDLVFAQTTIVETDFTDNTKQKYTDLKKIVGRV